MIHPLTHHWDILRWAADGRLPVSVSAEDGIDVGVLRELMEEGYMNGINANSKDGPCYLEPRITISGREYLAELESRIAAATFAGRVRKLAHLALAWVGGIITAVLVSWLSGQI